MSLFKRRPKVSEKVFCRECDNYSYGVPRMPMPDDKPTCRMRVGEETVPDSPIVPEYQRLIFREYDPIVKNADNHCPDFKKPFYRNL